MPNTTKTVIKAAEPVYTAHPCTAPFPPMSADQDAVLLADIKRNGLRERIIIDQHGRIVDGVHRYRACIKLGIEPEVEQRTLTDEEAWALSISRNLARRHLSEAQRAAISAELRKSANLPVTQVDAARAFNICERMQRSAETVFAASPELHQAVKNDQLAVHAAEQIAKLPPAERDAAIEKVKHGDVKAARELAKAARAGLTTKSRGGDKKDRKSIAKDAAGETKTAPAKATASTRSVAAPPKRSSGTTQNHKFHGTYALLLGELDQLPNYLDAHPLADPSAQHLASKLRGAAERVEQSNNE